MDQNFNQQPNQPYGQPNQPYGYQPYGQVKDLFCNILLVIMPLRMLLSIITNVMTFGLMGNADYYDLMDPNYLMSITASPGYTALSLLSNLLFIAYIVFVILDIVQINKARYKITGLVLFAIFLNYGYYIWRAYVLKRAKTFPVVYTVCYALLAVVNVIITVVYTMNMSLSMMNTMY